LKVKIKDYVLVENPTLHTVEVERTVELSEWELAVAIVADSVGYASPEHALRHVEDYKKGEKKAYCERACAIFKCDLERLIESAAYYWYKRSPEERERLKAFAERWREIARRDPVAGWTLSALYPTLNI